MPFDGPLHRRSHDNQDAHQNGKRERARHAVQESNLVSNLGCAFWAIILVSSMSIGGKMMGALSDWPWSLVLMPLWVGIVALFFGIMFSDDRENRST